MDPGCRILLGPLHKDVLERPVANMKEIILTSILGVSENSGPSYSTLNTRILMQKVEGGTLVFGAVGLRMHMA